MLKIAIVVLALTGLTIGFRWVWIKYLRPQLVADGIIEETDES